LKHLINENLIVLIVGFLFGAGLAVSGMTQPQKVIGFLDLFGSWDPSLAFVMIGAIGVHMIAFRLIKKRTSPLLADQFRLPQVRGLDFKLLAGAALFGIGWGLGGYCPGPALTSLVSLQATPFVLVGTMAAGMLAAASIAKKK
jgi:uncharacterized membrane protein YedE/YeeE